jgi:glycosyltransferase involved in cell wall biosynthesis
MLPKTNIKYRIAIDARLVTDKMVGIARYSLNLILGLLDNPDIELFCIINTNNLKSELEMRGYQDRVVYIRAKSYPISLTEHFEIPWLMVRHHIELFHATSYMTPVWVPCKFVYSVLDTFHLIFPEGFSWIANWYYKIVVRNAARKATCLVTISNASKKDIEKYISTKKQIYVTYLGYDNIGKTEKPFEMISAKYGIQNSGYFLFLGNHRVHKNFERVIRAYCLLGKTMNTLPRLVVNLGKNVQTKMIGKNPEVFNGVDFIGFVNDEDLYTLYKNALCLVVPSLYEGFGLNVLEAMDVGIPVITSNTSSLPEVAGDAALYVNPYDEKEIGQSMKRLMEDGDLCKSLIGRGKEQVRKFSWKKCADATYDIYKRVLEKKEAN